MNYSVLIVAAGKKASEGASYEKALASFNDKKSVLAQTISIFLNDDACKQVVIVASSADLRKVVLANESGKIVYVKGGKTRQESVLIGLTAISEDVVLIHDGVRPWVKQSLINRILSRMETEQACVLAIQPKASIRTVKDGYLETVVEKESIVMTQTPQAYNTSLIINCYQKAIKQGLTNLDDAEIVSLVSDTKIAVEKGDIRNTRFILKNN
ncbi:2-C-methyl-D-erythritol 4-phosphate cytidylyltransferase [Erysipelothrix inopinata]|uniref:2-C-methyl-D-erythritol 4-phosphate cytidylyltransferase n=1 Tax=Erysipelothrix inopinata TaxID=225084 RepID=A0A7G9S0Q1_9FIRM|nr:2-C-methyl-D-erythritol 4-phosphate cytidylyltransferase [Erysipelothrix inopinata]QNN61426.1 2-C-methyl-D-erythritol 4-phosphate cytidylyltransferase [Erysipelothrix inopinata]